MNKNSLNRNKIKHASIILFVVGYVNLCFQSNDDEIIWNEDRKLTWDDFTGKAHNPGTIKAATASGFGYTLETKGDSVEFNIECSFSKSKSWVISKSQNLLIHEQGHFDINEIHGRKYRKFLLKQKRFKRNRLKVDIKRTFSDAQAKCAAMQKKYDRETAFSVNEVKQAEWTQEIKKELENLKDYKQTRIVLPLRN